MIPNRSQITLEERVLNMLHLLAVSNHLQNISQIGLFPQVGVKIFKKKYATTT